MYYKKRINTHKHMSTDEQNQIKSLPPSPIKQLSIGPDTGTSEQALKKFIPIVEMVVRKEYRSIPSYLAEYSELINIGLLTVNKLLHDANKLHKNYNSSYIAQAVKWSIKDDLRTKYSWYGIKQDKPKEEELNTSYKFEEGNVDDDHIPEGIMQEAKEKVFETILYLDDVVTSGKSKDEMSEDELTKLELSELKAAVKRAIDLLPEKHKKVIELRFYQQKKGNDVANELGVTPSRVSHMISDAIEKVRLSLVKEGYTSM